MRLEGKSLKSDFLRFIIPSIIAQWVFSLYTMVDGIFVARGVSEVALTAVNISMPFTTGLFSISIPVSYTHLDVYKRQVLGSDELSVFAVFFNVAPFSESRSDILFILLDYNTKKENRNTGKIVLKIMRKF